MKSFLQLLRQFFMPFNGSPWLHYLGLALLPVLIITGFSQPRSAFVLAVADYMILLALPFMLAPKVLRGLICNRSLLLVPGFASRAVLTAFFFTLVQSGFLGFFASLYHVNGYHLRNATQLFVLSSAYIAVMQYVVTTAWAMFPLSIFPVTCIAAFGFLLQDKIQLLISDEHIVLLLVLALIGWVLATLRTRGRHQFRTAHKSLENYKIDGYQRSTMAAWLVYGSNAVADPAVSLLLGYPATLTARLRVQLYLVFLGPLIGTFFISIANFGEGFSWHPSVLDIFMGTSLYPLAFATFQNVEWVTRLRLLWLRSDKQRSRLWPFLEQQIVINMALLMLPCGVLTLSALLFSQLPAALLLHYPVLILVFNALLAYCIVCARISTWPTYWGLIVSIAGSCLMFGCLWVAIVWHDTRPFFGLEVLLIAGAFKFRRLARQKLQSIDWLVVKPLQARNAM